MQKNTYVPTIPTQYKHTIRQRDIHTERLAYNQTPIHTERQTKQSTIQTHRHTDIQTKNIHAYKTYIHTDKHIQTDRNRHTNNKDNTDNTDETDETNDANNTDNANNTRHTIQTIQPMQTKQTKQTIHTTHTIHTIHTILTIDTIQNTCKTQTYTYRQTKQHSTNITTIQNKTIQDNTTHAYRKYRPTDTNTYRQIHKNIQYKL